MTASLEPEPEPQPEDEMPRDSAGYIIAVFPQPNNRAIPVGSHVYTQFKTGVGSQGWALGTVTHRTPAVQVREHGSERSRTASGKTVAMYTVRISAEQDTHFRHQGVLRGANVEIPADRAPSRLIVVPSGQRVTLLAETAEYRRLVRPDSSWFLAPPHLFCA